MESVGKKLVVWSQFLSIPMLQGTNNVACEKEEIQ